MKRLIVFLIFGLSLINIAYAENSKIEIRGSIDDSESTLQDSGLITKYFTTGARQSQSVSLTGNSFTNIVIPTGAKAILIDVVSSDGIKIKGVTGDTGISLDSTVPVMLGISSDGSATLGFQNMQSTAETVRVYFF